MSSRARLFFLAAFFLFSSPLPLLAAGITFSPATATRGVGEEFSVTVRVSPDGQGVNAADGTISFDPAVLSVSSVSRDGSAFSLWTSDPVFSNSAGTITFSGGTPSAFTNTGTLLTIKFKGKAVGSGVVKVSKASILAADGKGTDVYKAGSDATYTIIAAAAKPPPPPVSAEPEARPEPTESGGTDSLVPPPDINSSTHKKPDQWYATSTAVMTWKIPPGMIGIRTLMSKDPDEAPKKESAALINSEKFENLEEGIWYFSAQFKDDFEWGGIGRREVRVDVTQPLEFDIALLESADGPPKFVFGTEDELSGMNRYEIFLQGAIAATVKPQDLIENAFPIPPQAGGMQTVMIKAYDNAGNVRELEKKFDLPYVEAPKPRGAPEEENTDSGFRYEWVVIALFAFVNGGLVAWQVQMRKNAQRGQALLLDHVLAARDRNDKVFAALREEFEQLINDFDEKPQLTASERDLLEKLKEALDISEEVVDTDIEDLKKLVKSMQ